MHPLFLKCSLELSPRHPGEYNGASDGLVLDIKLTSFINFLSIMKPFARVGILWLAGYLIMSLVGHEELSISGGRVGRGTSRGLLPGLCICICAVRLCRPQKYDSISRITFDCPEANRYLLLAE